jgi:hypothetical protein
VARFEAEDEDNLMEIQKLFKAEMHRLNNQLELPF